MDKLNGIQPTHSIESGIRSEEIKKQTEQFLSSGKQITQVPFGKSKEVLRLEKSSNGYRPATYKNKELGVLARKKFGSMNMKDTFTR